MGDPALLSMIAAHEQDETIVEHVLLAEHAERSESADFRRNKARLLKEQGHRCWLDTDVCDGNRPIEAHHLVEWSQTPKIDWTRLQALLLRVDPYGYSAQLVPEPIESVDDIRNLVLLCDTHHRGVGLGVHHLSFPTWLAMRARRPGESITREEAQLRPAA